MILKRVGGKALISSWIVKHIPIGTVYVDAFGGSGAIIEKLIETRTSIKNRFVYNDLDKKFYLFFKLLKEQNEELAHLINITPYSRKIFEEAVEIFKSEQFNELTDLDKTLYFLIANRQSFNSLMNNKNSWSITKKTGHEINYNTWKGLPDYVLKLFNLFKSAYIENLDYKELVTKWDSKDTVFYFDPPYEDVEQDYYEVNKTDVFNHNDLMEVCLSMKGSFALSYYANDKDGNLTELIKKYIDCGFYYNTKEVVKHMSTQANKEKLYEIIITNKKYKNKKINELL